MRPINSSETRMMHRWDTPPLGLFLLNSFLCSLVPFSFQTKSLINTFINILLLLDEKQILRSKVSVAALTDSLYTEQHVTWG